MGGPRRRRAGGLPVISPGAFGSPKGAPLVTAHLVPTNSRGRLFYIFCLDKGRSGAILTGGIFCIY